MNPKGELSEAKIFDIVAQYLFKRPLNEARIEFSLFLFSEWSKSNFDIILEAISSIPISNSKNIKSIDTI